MPHPLPTFDRIRSVIDVDRLRAAEVAIIGTGGSVTLACDLVRCGVERLRLYDFDLVEAMNIARQDHMTRSIGMAKVEALASILRQINPAVQIASHPIDFCTLTDDQVEEHFAASDLFLFATDSFTAQARGNEVALRLHRPAVWVGLYEGGLGGEVCFWHPGLDCCFRCLCAKRYEAHERLEGRSPVTSHGTTIFDIRFPDAIAGMIAVGLLTRGSENRFGWLIDALGDRQFLQMKLDPGFHVHGRDIIREKLQVPADNDAFFAWNTIALRDPDRGQLPCKDCERLRGVTFAQDAQGRWHRQAPAAASQP